MHLSLLVDITVCAKGYILPIGPIFRSKSEDYLIMLFNKTIKRVNKNKNTFKKHTSKTKYKPNRQNIPFGT